MDWYESGAHDWKTDSGYITDHHKLPIKSVEFTTLTTNQKLRITVGPLVCEEGEINLSNFQYFSLPHSSQNDT